jgi:glycosyltransferase involved in cell wall biosynthesis
MSRVTSISRGMTGTRRGAPDRISVIVPARDAAATIGGQLAALAAQRYEGSWEVIVADNGSADATATVADRWIGRIPGLRVVDASGRRGASHARNVGIAASRSDFLAFCDADDEVDAGWLAAMSRAATRCDLVAGYIDMRSLNDPTIRKWTDWEFPTDQLPRGLGFLPFGVGANLGAWRFVLDAVGGWDETYRSCTDVWLSWRVQLESHELCFARDAVVRYRLRDSLPGVTRQAFNIGRAEAQLFRDFRCYGATRAGFADTVRFWAGAIRRLPRAISSRARRGAWRREVAWRSGRLSGSVRYRVWFP